MTQSPEVKRFTVELTAEQLIALEAMVERGGDDACEFLNTPYAKAEGYSDQEIIDGLREASEARNAVSAIKSASNTADAFKEHGNNNPQLPVVDNMTTEASLCDGLTKFCTEMGLQPASAEELHFAEIALTKSHSTYRIDWLDQYIAQWDSVVSD